MGTKKLNLSFCPSQKIFGTDTIHASMYYRNFYTIESTIEKDTKQNAIFSQQKMRTKYTQ